MIKRLLILWMILLSAVLVIQAQESPLPLAVEFEDNLYVMTTLPATEEDLPAALTRINEETGDNYFGYQAAWSPDDTKVAFVETGTLKVWNGQEAIDLVSGGFGDIPIGWMRDGLIVYMVIDPDVPLDGIAAKMMIYTIPPEAGAQPDLVIRDLPVNVGCGIGTTLPMEGQLSIEAGQAALRPILALTDYGLIYPAECGGGISLFRPFSQETVTFEGNMTSATVSPDGNFLAGIVQAAPDSFERKLLAVNLLTMEQWSPVTTDVPTVAAWDAHGNLYYAAVIPTAGLLDNLTPEQVTLVETQTQNKADTHYFDANTIRLYRIDVDGHETLLAEQDGYAVGRLAVKGSTLVYSTIPNGDAWVQAIADGTLSGENVYFGDAYNYMSTSVNYLVLDDAGTVVETGAIPGDLWRMAVPN